MAEQFKQTFMLRELNRYFKESEDLAKLFIARKKIGKTDALLNSFRHSVKESGSGATGELVFKEYGRFVDMGVGRGHPLGTLAKTKVALQASRTEGEVFIKSKAFKPKKFYSPVVYGRLIYLNNRLLYGYTQGTIDMLKEEFKNSNK